jgi:dihydrofolate reductase
MRKLSVFNHVSLDGYFVDKNGQMSWAKNHQDAEWNAFVSENASGGGVLVFGRVTYEMMASFWPTPAAMEAMPDVAERMNNLPKVVFSRTLDKATWNNTRLIKGDLVGEMRKLKEESGDDMVIMGSGTIISQLTPERLIDSYQVVVNPLVLGEGRTMFEDVKEIVNLKLKTTRAFGNGNVVLTLETAK